MFGDLRQKQRAEDCGEGGSEGYCVGLRGGSWEDQLCDRAAVSAAHGGVESRRKVDGRTEIFKQGDYYAGCIEGCSGLGEQWHGERREDFGLGVGVGEAPCLAGWAVSLGVGRR